MAVHPLSIPNADQPLNFLFENISILGICVTSLPFTSNAIPIFDASYKYADCQKRLILSLWVFWPFGECVIKGGQVEHPFEMIIMKHNFKNYNETGSQATSQVPQPT